MSPRVRLALWALAVAACALSPALFRLVASWAGAAWQCVCLGGILALYATTPADAIRLPRWASKFLIVGGMVAWPWLCYGRVTLALVVTPAAVFLLDHVALTFVWDSRNRQAAWVGQRWSWRPGVASDWIAVVLLWSPLMWYCLVETRPTEGLIPHVGALSTLLALTWLHALQVPAADGGGIDSRHPDRIRSAAIFSGLAGAIAITAELLRQPADVPV